MLDSLIFWAFSLVAVSAALGAVLNRSIIYAALCLIAVFMSIAGFYLLNNADFLAIAQIIIYAVGLTIIMLFAIMFTGDKPMVPQKVNQTAKVAYGIVIAYVAALFIRAMMLSPSTTAPNVSSGMAELFQKTGSTELVGFLLFNKYALPFELASILLLSAMIGAIVIAKKQFVESESDLLGEVSFALDTTSAPPEDALEALRQKRLLEHHERKELMAVGTQPSAAPETRSSEDSSQS